MKSLSRRILLVDDSADEREMYAEALRLKGFCTLQASNATDAFRMAVELQPQLIVVDRDLLRFMAREPHWDTATVAEVMKPQPVTVRSETPLSTAIAEMLTRRINCLPVLDEAGRVCGILTSTDLLRAFQQIQAWIEQTGKAGR